MSNKGVFGKALEIQEEYNTVAIQKYLGLKSQHDKARGYEDIYKKYPENKTLLNSAEYGELIDKGYFNNFEKDPNKEEFHKGMKDNFFSQKPQNTYDLQTQAKFILGTDLPITNADIEKHLTSSIQYGQIDYVKDLINEPKIAHVFHNKNQAEEIVNNENLPMFQRAQAKITVMNNSTRAPHQDLQHHDLDIRAKERQDYNSTTAGLVLQCMSATLPPKETQQAYELGASIVAQHPWALNNAIGKHQFLNQGDFANFIAQPQVFNSMNNNCKNFLVSEQIRKMNQGDSQQFSFPVAMVFMKQEDEHRPHLKKQLTDVAIANKNLGFLSEVAKHTDYRFDKEQLDNMKLGGNINTFSEVLHESSKKELHDKLTTTLAPKQKTKALKI